jgi:hypothetical protein
MVEHRTPNPGDGGSNPSWPATIIRVYRHQVCKPLTLCAVTMAIDFTIKVLDCVIGRRRITIQPPPSGLAKIFILKPIYIYSRPVRSFWDYSGNPVSFSTARLASRMATISARDRRLSASATLNPQVFFLQEASICRSVSSTKSHAATSIASESVCPVKLAAIFNAR